MTQYKAAIQDIQWALQVLRAGLDADTHQAIFLEAAKLAEGTIAPLNAVGDKHGTPVENGTPKMPAGFKEAYQAFCAGGWNGAPFPVEQGGQGLPWAVVFGLHEIWQGANLAFGLCPLLTQGAAETILSHGTPEQVAAYVPKLVRGAWSGTMNLTEPQAGSDLGAVRSMATPQADGTYRIKGQKIYITYGNHALTDNIIHLVLARTPNAPEGSKGLSLFIVPKILASGAVNDVQSVSVEHKMGIHASPTCAMVFGDVDGAEGYLLGDLHGGLKHMFTMMNNARLSVGVQGVGLSARVESMAYGYAADRVQFKPIIQHADVRRMLLTISSLTDAARLMAIYAGKALDAGDQAVVDVLTPLVKGFGTDVSVETSNLGVQIYGGMGFVEDGGMAQNYRDARILPIYEGTNGIQAADFTFRKVQKDNGAALKKLMTDLLGLVTGAAVKGDDLEASQQAVVASVAHMTQALDHILTLQADDAGAVATPFAQLAGAVIGGALLHLSAATAQQALAQGDFSMLSPDKLDRKILQARFYAEHILPPKMGLLPVILDGSKAVGILG